MRVCERCGVSLEGRHGKARFCSRDCQVAAYRAGPSYTSSSTRREPAIRVPRDLYDRLGVEAYARQMTVADFTRRLLTEALDTLIPADQMRVPR